jgi:hypothetical protein
MLVPGETRRQLETQTMQYMLLIMGDESRMNPPEVEDTGMSADHHAYTQALLKAGAMRGGERLHPTSSASTVKVRDGKAVVLDGPYVESQEQLGGYYLIEAASLDEAIGWAVKCPAAAHGAIEVRPVWPTRADA